MVKRKIAALAVLILLLISMEVYTQDLIEAIYKDPYFLQFNSHYYRDDAIDENGCSIQNQSAERFRIIDQILCSHAVAHGIGTGNESHIRKGINAIWYGFEKEYNGRIFKSSPIAHTSRFLFAAALCYLDIQFSTDAAIRDKYMKEFQSNALKISSSAYWIKESEQLKKDMPGIKKSANQMISLGILYTVIGELVNDNGLRAYGQSFLEDGLAMQTDDGVFLENGGFDSSYQAFNLLLVSCLYIYFDDPSLHKKAFTMLQKGWKYELNFISPTGEISASENTRTGAKQEMWGGKYKSVNYPEVAISLLYWSHISEDNNMRELAKKIFYYGAKK